MSGISKFVKNVQLKRYLNIFNFDGFNDIYLSLFIKSKNNISDKEFIQLNFE